MEHYYQNIENNAMSVMQNNELKRTELKENLTVSYGMVRYFDMIDI